MAEKDDQAASERQIDHPDPIPEEKELEGTRKEQEIESAIAALEQRLKALEQRMRTKRRH